MLVLQPALQREVRRQVEIKDEVLTDRWGVAVKANSVVYDGENKRKSLKIKEGDRVWIEVSGTVKPKGRFLLWSAHPDLCAAGVIAAGKLDVQEPEVTSPSKVRFVCAKDIDLEKLDYILKGYLVDQVVR